MSKTPYTCISILRNKRRHNNYEIKIRYSTIYRMVTIVNNTDYVFESCQENWS